MTLSELMTDIFYTGSLQDCDIHSVTSDTRQVEPGSLFVCIKGSKFDGHDHVRDALDAGAAAVVTEKDLGLSNQVLVKNTREIYGIICGNFFGNPAKKLKLLAVTGTNGKTSITYLLKHILEHAEKKVGLIGTIHNQIADITFPSKYTTPDPLQLHAMFSRMEKAGCEYVVMEASSHALDQNRLTGLRFESAIFTNLTQDHLDYHKTMENYYQAKKRLFAMTDNAVINIDDEYGRRLISEAGCQVHTFSCETDEADFTAHDRKSTAKGSTFTVVGEGLIYRVKFAMPGGFSVSNAMAAAVCCLSVGIDFDTVMEGLCSCEGVAGRTEILPTDTTYTVMRDYAHSPDGLEKVLHAVNEFAPGRVVTLFGCAGNRDRTKRPQMGEIAARLSDFVILTSDNPRDEDPARIVEDVIPGLLEHDTPHKVIVDRYQAIKWALDNCRDDDILILAGKGHEDYQVLEQGTIYFDEKVIVKELLEKKKKEHKEHEE